MNKYVALVTALVVVCLDESFAARNYLQDVHHQSGIGITTRHYPISYMMTCYKHIDCNLTILEYCSPRGVCDCRPPSQYNFKENTCKPCPDTDVTCSECCTGYGYECLSGICHDYISPPAENPPSTTVIYVTASQIVLSVTVIMGSIALIMLLYRICSKPANRPPTRPNPSSSRPHSTFQRLSQRLSLTSMQIRIMARLRDQPPKYETQHNYDTRIQQDLERQNTTMDTETPNTQQVVHTITTAMTPAPPAYGDEQYSLSDLPPPYTPSIVIETVLAASDSGIHPEGTPPSVSFTSSDIRPTSSAAP